MLANNSLESAYNEFDFDEEKELIFRAKKGDNKAFYKLYKKYEELIKFKGNGYFFIDGDYEDVLQESKIGFLKAVRDYNFSKNIPFRSFVFICIDRHMTSAVIRSRRKKNLLFNEALRYDVSVKFNRDDGESNYTYLDFIFDNRYLPEKILIEEEDFKSLKNLLKLVSTEYEFAVIGLYLENKKYEEIATILEVNIKSVDNAIQRVRKKLKKVLEESNSKKVLGSSKGRGVRKGRKKLLKLTTSSEG